jgi:hypothetical protein
VFAVALVTTGIGFKIVSVREAEIAGEATLTAVIVTELGLGILAGGVYMPLVEISPELALPPVTPFTCHATPELVVFVTVDVS